MTVMFHVQRVPWYPADSFPPCGQARGEVRESSARATSSEGCPFHVKLPLHVFGRWICRIVRGAQDVSPIVVELRRECE